MKYYWRTLGDYNKSSSGKRIVKSHTFLSEVSVNKSVNMRLNRENLFSKHKTDVKGVTHYVWLRQ
jgi:hypothetical protein